IDLVISSHPDADHIDGLFTVLENMPVSQLLYSDCFADNDLQQHMLYLAQQNGAILAPAYTGMRFALEPGLTLEVCHPAAASYYSERDNNQGCLTVLITYDKIKFLLTGDVHLGDLQQIPAANIVKLPHHGSKSNYDEDAYAKLYAEAVVISVGRDNSYGHPGQNVIEYWQEKAIIYRTDRHGAVSIFSDGLSWRAGTYWNN
ncbi:MAG: MBL fold metallo-hydrolase, partial [Clostridiales bacterium]|nr:MBL fold metallo-hydrolase [Clostridiales bacterium]